MTTAKVSFVVPLFNHLADTQAMLTSLRASLPAALDYEIILIDDCSTDGSRDWLQGLNDGRIKTVLNPKNLGFARTNNIGARAASGEILGLLNSDLLLEPGWLQPMLEVLHSARLNAGVVGNLQYRVADGSLDHAGVQLSCAGKFEHIQTLPEGGPDYSRVIAVTGACMLMRRADFVDLGGFDETFVNGCEDVDLCFRLKKAGKLSYVARASRVRHHVSLSRDRTTLQNERNSRHLFGKWRSEVKSEIALQWAAVLRSPENAYRQWVDGELNASFLSTPHAAARILAECMLQREEARWARDLGDLDPNAGLADRCRARGLRYSGEHQGYLIEGGFELSVDELRSARNFYVCGRKIDPLDTRPMAIIICVNDIQRKIFPLTESAINAGIIDPVLLSGVPNVFRVEVNYLDPSSKLPAGDASKVIVFTHIVIDDQVVDRL